MNSYYDYINAVEFGHHCALEHQYHYFLNKYPHIFKHVDLHTRAATPTDYYVPAAIAPECQIFSVTFNETGCRKVGCFPKTSTLTDCTEQDPTTYITIGDQAYLACQPACHELSPFIDTEFKEGHCWQTNTEKKIFALFPEQIHNVQVYQPMHQGLSLKNGDLALNPAYCTAFGLSFENDDCLAPLGQEIGEFFLGSTVYKSLKKLTIPPTAQLSTPSIPPEVATLSNWLEGSPSRKHSTNPYTVNASMPYLPPETLSKVVKAFMQDVAMDVGSDLTLDYSLKVMKKRLPQTLVKASQVVLNPKMIHSALWKAVTQSHTLTLANAARGVLSTLSKLNVALSVFSIVSNVVDLFDPFNYNYVLDKATLARVNEHLDFAFYRSNTRQVEVTPEKIWNLLEEDMSVYIDKLEEKMDYYLEAVKMEDYQTRTTLQKDLIRKKKPKVKYPWMKMFHIAFVMVLVMTSIVFLQYIAYFMLIYLIFILWYPPSFY